MITSLDSSSFEINLCEIEFVKTEDCGFGKKQQSSQHSSKQKGNVTFLGRCVPFMFSALKKYLNEDKSINCQTALKMVNKMWKEKNTAQNPCRQNKNQSKLELGNLRTLIHNNNIFLKVWQEFLESQFLMKHIEKSKKIKEENKNRYKYVAKIMLNELQKPSPYYKFITQSNYECLSQQQFQYINQSNDEGEIDFENQECEPSRNECLPELQTELQYE